MNTEVELSLASMIQERLESVLTDIRNAARSVGRNPDRVRLVVVTKSHPMEAVSAAISAGAKMLGESYPGEGVDKILSIDSSSNVAWHMIGHIQSRKARLVSKYYDYVHSADRVKIIDRLNRYAAEMNKTLPILLECNVSGEVSKHGFAAWDEGQWHELSHILDTFSEKSYLDIRGLMTIPPYSENPENSRQYFTKLRRLRDFLARKNPGFNLNELSMGMSADYRVAVQEGATIVRIGTAIMGARPQSDI
jgi:hypothetical protein